MTSHSYTPLSQTKIKTHLNSNSLELLDEILIFSSVTSTNDKLWCRLTDENNYPAVCLSEAQTAGRGRRGDHWHSPDSGNLYLSISWPFPAETSLNGLSIAIGIALINTLKSEGINDLQLKWPNDVLHKRRKLAGILVESRFGKKQNTVVGVGLNIELPTHTQQQIQQATTSLQQLCTHVPCRNELAGKIINSMITTLQHFQSYGLHDFIEQWPFYDALHNQPITLINDDVNTEAIACGINDNGELKYKIGDKSFTLSNSHISIRFAS